MFLSNDAIKEAAAGNGFLLGSQRLPTWGFSMVLAYVREVKLPLWLLYYSHVDHCR